MPQDRIAQTPRRPSPALIDFMMRASQPTPMAAHPRVPLPPMPAMASHTPASAPDAPPRSANELLMDYLVKPGARALGWLVQALDAPPSRNYPTNLPYTSPLRVLGAANAVLPAAAGLVTDAATGQRPALPVVDPMAPIDEQATFAGEAARRNLPSAVRAAGTLADLLVGPEHGLQVLGAAVPLVGALGNVPGLYSRVERAVEMVPAKGAKAESVLNLMQKAPGGLNPEELAWRKVPEFLEGQRGQVVTPDALRAHLEANPLNVAAKTLTDDRAARVAELDGAMAAIDTATQHLQASLGQVDAANLGWMVRNAADGDADSMAWLRTHGVTEGELPGLLAQGRRANEASAALTNVPPPAKYGSHTLPGGDDYRETLLTLPRSPQAQAVEDAYGAARRADADALDKWKQQSELHGRDSAEASAAREAWLRTQRELSRRADEIKRLGKPFTSSHFISTPNIVVHTRSKTRALSTGEPGRFLEEVQSDWHQAGKSRGYNTGVVRDFDAETNQWVVSRDGRELARDSDRHRALQSAGVDPRDPLGSGVANAPFKDAWPDLGLKQQLHEAASDPQAQWLGFTTGGTQAKRYDLSKRVDTIVATKRADGNVRLIAKSASGGEVLDTVVAADQVEGHLGKELAAKIASQPEETQRYSGLDLQLGGKGMATFYDQVLPKRLEKIVKPFGGRVERLEVATTRGKAAPAWVVRLTPEMKQRILREGLPLLSLGGLMMAGNARPQEAR